MANARSPASGDPPQQRVESDPLEFVTFDEFFSAHFHTLTMHAWTFGAESLDQAKDAAQEAMTQAFKNWPLRSPLAWARTATVHCLISLKRQERRRIKSEGKLAILERLEVEIAEDPRMNVWADTEWVRAMLATLPAMQRRIVALLVDSHKPSDIAELLGKTPQAVRASLFKARLALQNEIKRRQAVEDLIREEIR